jgi:acetyl esterase
MNLHPAVRAHLDALDPISRDGMGIEERRRHVSTEVDHVFTLFGLPGPTDVAVRDHAVPVNDGTITVRAYHPGSAARPDTEARLPAHVLLHGGGWSTGSIDDLVCDATARHRAVGADCVVALVEYRLAPEHRFPAAVYDTVAAVHWIRDHAGELGVDPSLVTLGGASAGANLAAAAQVADATLELTALLLEVPALDLSGDGVAANSSTIGSGDAVLRRDQADVTAVRRLYLGDDENGTSPLASPLLASDLSHFPETHILTGALDPLHVDGERFAARLSAAGVLTHLTCYPGVLHGSTILNATFPTARRWHDDTLAILRHLHDRGASARTETAAGAMS